MQEAAAQADVQQQSRGPQQEPSLELTTASDIAGIALPRVAAQETLVRSIRNSLGKAARPPTGCGGVHPAVRTTVRPAHQLRLGVPHMGSSRSESHNNHRGWDVQH